MELKVQRRGGLVANSKRWQRVAASCLAILSASLLIACGGDTDLGATSTPTQLSSQDTEAVPTATQEPPASTLEPPTATPEPEPTLHVVEAGDSLSAICALLVPELSGEECISQTVLLNDLADAGQIAVGQVLTLPGGTSATTDGLDAAQATPSTQASDSGEGVTIAALTSPISPGQSATLSVKSSPGANCSIRYLTPQGNQSRATGLEAQVADADGNASWTWNINTNTGPGTGTVQVTCDGESATADLVIA
jgi:LysM repeat protein